MLIHAVTKRRRECSALMFLAFMLGCAVVIALPGFLYFYFWEGAGVLFSAFIGFLLGNFVLSVLEMLGGVVALVRGMLRRADRWNAARAVPNDGGEDDHG